MSADILWETFLFQGMVAGCLTDLMSRRLPNRLCAAIGAGGLLHAFLLAGWAGLGQALGASAAAGGLLLLAYVPGWVAAGDVKYFAALATFLMPGSVAPAFLAATSFGGLLAMGVILTETLGSLRLSYRNSSGQNVWPRSTGQKVRFLAWLAYRRATYPARPRATVPYAVALACGVWAVRSFPPY